MTEQRERLEKDLNRCAALGVPDTVDLWTGIEQRVSSAPRRSRQFRFVPRTRMAWAVTALTILLFGMGAYAATGLVYDMFRSELPGAEGPVFGEKLDLTQKAYEAKVNVEWVYADASYVVVGYSIDDLRKDRRVAGHPAELDSIAVIDELGYEKGSAKEFPDRVKLTDGSGKKFRLIDGGGMTAEGPDKMINEPLANTVVFATPDKIKTGQKHRFRLEIPLEARTVTAPGEKEVPPEPVGKPFVFDFEVPVPPVPVVDVNQTVEANGVKVSLERVVDSPRANATICFKPPNNKYVWSPTVKKTGLAWSEPADGYLETHRISTDCWIATLSNKASNYSSLTVTKVTGWPRDGSGNGPEDEKKIRGPWRFDFEVPEQ